MEEEIDIKDIFIGLWEKRKIIIVVTIIFALLGIIYSQISNDIPECLEDASQSYIASNTFKLGNKEKKVIAIESEDSEESNNKSEVSDTIAVIDSGKSGLYYVSDDSITVDETTVEVYSEILKSTDTLNKINEKYGINLSSNDWSQLVSISQVNETELLSIKFEYIDSEIAVEVVDDLTEILEDYITDMYSSYKIYPITIIDSTKIISESSLVNSLSIKTIAIITAIGFIFICIVISLIEFLKNNVRNSEHLEKISEVKNLAKISENDDYDSESIKMLRINIENCKSLLLTTPVDVEEKNNIAIKLAKSFTKLDKKVILIDLNNKNLNLIKKYNNKGIVDYLNGNDKFVEKYANESTIKNLNILTLGTSLENTTELLESHKMKESIDTLERLFDIVIIDSPNVLNSANTFAISKLTKNSILIVKERKEKVSDIKLAKKNIEDIGGRVIGTILKRG